MCVGLAALTYGLTNVWEQVLRKLFVSPKPPRKGYEVYKHLLATATKAANTNGALTHQHTE